MSSPVDIPAAGFAWRPVRAPSRLAVPLHPRPGEAIASTPEGTAVTAGQQVVTADQRFALVPAAGTFVGIRDNRARIDTGPTTVSPPELPPSLVIHERDMAAAELEQVRADQRGHWFDTLRLRGVHADRRLCPDLHGQLRAAQARPVDAVVCCVLDSDPTLQFASAVLSRFLGEVVAGTAAIGRLCGARRTVLVVDADAPSRQLAAVRAWCRRLGVALERLNNPYPQADPTLLLYALLDRRLRPGRPPVDAGVVLLDPPAAAAVAHAVVHGEPVTHALVGVRDHATAASHFAVAPVGSSAAHVLGELSIGTRGRVVRADDLFRDNPIAPADAVIGEGELTLHVTPGEPVVNPDPCVRAGWCLDVCPTRIHPAALLDAAQRRDRDMAEQFGIDACIECGLCTYVCPSRLPLMQSIRGMRDMPK
ncbi:MAG TPA: 4Fe-4S dicluster domain-containing protein [Tepidisphaeraceae bacterium]|nr:4Fe-4S dicluster domain-containing protein [Tepidisphaeraceae bacterium]